VKRLRSAHALHLVLSPPVGNRLEGGVPRLGVIEEDGIDDDRDVEEEEERRRDRDAVLLEKVDQPPEAVPEVEASPWLGPRREDRREHHRAEDVEVLFRREGDGEKEGCDGEVAKPFRPDVRVE
jgi:hypothetical protein